MMIDLTFLHIIFLLGILSCAIFAAGTKNLLHATIGLAVMSVLLAMEFFMLRAPDVAIAEASIGTAITTALFIIAIRATGRSE